MRRLKRKAILRILLPLVPAGCHMLVAPEGSRIFAVMGVTGNITGGFECYVFRPEDPAGIPDFLGDVAFRFPPDDEVMIDPRDGTRIVRFHIPIFNDLASVNVLSMQFKDAMGRLDNAG